jgi:hypothetical protein
MKLKITQYSIIFIFLLASQIGNAQTTYFVDASKPDNSGAGTTWASAKKDLQLAINNAVAGDQVWVKAGTYLPTHDPFNNSSPANNRDKTFTLKNGVKVYGGFTGTESLLSQRNWKINVTTLSGDLGVLNNQTDNAYHVVLSVNLTNTTVLDGFTVTKGYATAPGNSTITVNTRVIERYHGGGVFNSYSSTSFTNCTISLNSADCTNTDNDAVGAGIINNSCSSTFTNCLIDSNSFLVGGASFGVFGAGMAVNGGNCSIISCVFSNNSSGSGFIDTSRGGAMTLDGTATIQNTVFYNNSSQNGAAIQFGSGSNNLSTVTNCTFTNNTSSFAGTAYQGYSKATFKNCIFWNNAPTSGGVTGRNEIYSQENNVANQPTFINCIIRDANGNPLGVTNTILTNCLNSNPLFSNITDGNGSDNIWATIDDGLTIQNTSPAKNFGTSGAGIPSVDIIGNARDTQPDLGAYEYQNACINPTVFNVSGGGSFCAAGSGLAITVSNSEIGVTYQLKNSGSNIGTPLNGTGTSISFGNQTAAGTYTVEAIRTLGGCSSTMNGSAIITINPNLTPTFTAVNPICSGETLTALPTTANNGVTGTWSPALNNTATTTYTFTPTAGQCATTSTLIITVNTTPIPTGNSIQNFNITNGNNATLADLIVSPLDVIWYATLSDANSGINPLSIETILTDGASYFAVSTINECPSLPFEVIVNVTLGTNSFDNKSITVYPIPTRGLIHLDSKFNIKQISITNNLGQTLIKLQTNSKNSTIDLSSLASSVYYLRIESEMGLKIVRIVKE